MEGRAVMDYVIDKEQIERKILRIIKMDIKKFCLNFSVSFQIYLFVFKFSLFIFNICNFSNLD